MNMNYIDFTFDVIDANPIICLIFLLAFWYIIIPGWIILGIGFRISQLFIKEEKKEEKKIPPIDNDRFPQLSEIYNKVHNA